MITSCLPEEIDLITDFIRETVGSRKAVIGVSGGVDSAVCMHLCTRALGPQNVIAVHLPSGTTPSDDTKHAFDEASRLNVQISLRQIQLLVNSVVGKVGDSRSPDYKKIRGNVAARLRMVLLYTLANKYNGMVCGTGNRTEFWLGYTTKYGDNAGDFYPILHLLKTEVWGLATELGVSPDIITKPPSAGLWNGQTDEGEIGMSYYDIDREIVEFLAGDGPVDEMILSRHLENQHKSEPGRSLLATRW